MEYMKNCPTCARYYMGFKEQEICQVCEENLTDPY